MQAAFEHVLKPRIQALHAEFSTAQRTKHPKVAKCGDYRFGSRLAAHAFQIALVTGQHTFHELIHCPSPPRRMPMHTWQGCCPEAAQLCRIRPVDGAGQLANATLRPKPVTVTQQGHSILQRMSSTLVHGDILTGQPMQRSGKLGRVVACLPAQFAQHRPGLHRTELILVPQQDQPRLRWQGPNGLGQQGQIHHGGFVDHQHV